MKLKNKIQCRKCGDIIESTSRHDIKLCGCGAVGVDGGLDYARRIGHALDIRELYEFVPEEFWSKDDETE